MQGLIFDIQRFSVHDGPGIRTTVFLKGCPLSCIWCHNPEGLSYHPQVKFLQNECIGCGRCGQKTLADVANCPVGALQVCGTKIGEEALLQHILKDKPFYRHDGGVTFSGGECLTQADFVVNMLARCKEQGLHTAIDTSGYVPFEAFEKTLPYCDLYLYDLKIMDGATHKHFTGVDNWLILENLKKLVTRTENIWLRLPIIPTVNDDPAQMNVVARFVKTLGKPLPITLIPYHGLGSSKYQTLGYEYQYRSQEKITQQKLAEFKQIFISYGITVN